jgi:hypothetical protein
MMKNINVSDFSLDLPQILTLHAPIMGSFPQVVYSQGSSKGSWMEGAILEPLLAGMWSPAPQFYLQMGAVRSLMEKQLKWLQFHV